MEEIPGFAGRLNAPGQCKDKDDIMENIKELYHRYFDQIVAWYDGLDQLYQYGVFFLIMVVGFFVIAFYLLSRITK
jgi:hypothetical protein